LYTLYNNFHKIFCTGFLLLLFWFSLDFIIILETKHHMMNILVRYGLLHVSSVKYNRLSLFWKFERRFSYLQTCRRTCSYSAHLSWKLSFSDRRFSVVRPYILLSVIFYIFDFSITTGPILTRLGTNHLWGRELKSLQM
jgi:hypothetical protein